MRSTLLAVLVAATLCGPVAGAEAHSVTLDVVGLSGGTITYDGTGTPLIANDLPINMLFGIPTGAPILTVTGGLLDFSTGPQVGSNNPAGPSFQLTFGEGGSFIITGGIPSLGITDDNTLLVQGSFLGLPWAGAPTLDFNGVFGMLTGTLDIDFLNPAISQFLGFTSPPNLGLGALAQVDLGFSGPPTGPDSPFSASQSSLNVAIAVAQPAPLLLLGIGLITVTVLVRANRLARRSMKGSVVLRRS
jgi:hypothetical protein